MTQMQNKKEKVCKFLKTLNIDKKFQYPCISFIFFMPIPKSTLKRDKGKISIVNYKH